MTVRLRHVLLVLAAACLVTGTGAFSGASTDRDPTIGIAGPDSAYLGIESDGIEATLATVPESNNTTDDSTAAATDRTPTNETTVELLTVTNRLQSTLDVTASIASRSSETPSVENVSGVTALSPGETSPLTATVTCGIDTASDTLELTIVAIGDGVAIETTETVTVTCAG